MGLCLRVCRFFHMQSKPKPQKTHLFSTKKITFENHLKFAPGEIDPFDDKEGRKMKEYMESNAFRDDKDEYGQLGLQLSTMVRKSSK